MQLILIRHGNTFEKDQTPLQIGCKTDLDLTQEGKEQIRKLRGMFPNTCIYSGPLKRQIQSAQILSDKTPVICDCLNELDYGLWEGLTSATIEKNWPFEYKNWNENSIWPEYVFKKSLSDHLLGLKNWLCEIQKIHANDETVVAITSNGLLRIFSKLCDFPIAEKVKTGHFCQFELSENRIVVLAWNLGEKLCK